MHRIAFTACLLIATLCWGVYMSGWRTLDLVAWENDQHWYGYPMILTNWRYQRMNHKEKAMMPNSIFAKAIFAVSGEDEKFELKNHLHSRIAYDPMTKNYLYSGSYVIISLGYYQQITIFDVNFELQQQLRYWDRELVSNQRHDIPFVNLYLELQHKTTGESLRRWVYAQARYVADANGEYDLPHLKSKYRFAMQYYPLLSEEEWKTYHLISDKPIEIQLLSKDIPNAIHNRIIKKHHDEPPPNNSPDVKFEPAN